MAHTENSLNRLTSNLQIKYIMSLISSVLTLMFANKGITDNVDLMRCNILAMTIENHINTGTIPTLDEVKETSSYRSLDSVITVSDEFLQKLIDKAVQLYEKEQLNNCFIG